MGSAVVLLMMMLLVLFAVHCTWVTSNAYSSPSVVLSTNNYDGYGTLISDTNQPSCERKKCTWPSKIG